MERVESYMPSLNQTIFLNSWFFLGLVVAAVLYCQLVRHPKYRNLGVTGISLYFLSFFIPDLATLSVLCCYLAVVYLLGQWRLSRSEDISATQSVSIVVCLWAFLFLIKGPDLFAPANPFFHFPVQIIGISYITFRSISYFTDLDVIEGSDFLSFIGYMIFFPTLLAGPLARYDEFLESWREPTPADTNVLKHLHRIGTGAIQKFIIADNLAVWGAFSIGEHYSSYHPALVGVSIPIQFFLIFFDFAGYTNMMIGIAGLMGFSLPENFNKPWLAKNVQEFWQRWHMSMTRFIRDYIYTPIVREGLRRASSSYSWMVPIAVNFFCLLLIALWHAPTLGFLVFGLTHGIALTLTQLYRSYYPHTSGDLWQVKAWTIRSINILFIATTMVLWQFGPSKTVDILLYVVGY